MCKGSPHAVKSKIWSCPRIPILKTYFLDLRWRPRAKQWRRVERLVCVSPHVYHVYAAKTHSRGLRSDASTRSGCKSLAIMGSRQHKR